MCAVVSSAQGSLADSGSFVVDPHTVCRARLLRGLLLILQCLPANICWGSFDMEKFGTLLGSSRVPRQPGHGLFAVSQEEG